MAILLSVLAVVAVLATFAIAYAAIFTHDSDLGIAACLTLWLDILLGGAAAFAWANGGAS